MLLPLVLLAACLPSVVLSGGSGGRAGPAFVEPDWRDVPWSALRRLALEGGGALPPLRPLARVELEALLLAAARAGAPALDDPQERALLTRLLDAYGAGADGPRVAWGGRVRIAQSDLGTVPGTEAGLALAPGLSIVAEPAVTLATGRWWGAVAPRVSGRIAATGRRPPAGLLHPGWSLATGAPAWDRAREADGAWCLAWPRVVAGARLGDWAVSLGWAPASTGPGDAEGLLLSASGRDFPAITLRRAAPLVWRGPLRRLAPSALLVRVGRLSEQVVVARDGWSAARAWRAQPWLGQWLAAWTPARWLTAGASLSALATPRHGSLLPDALQIAFPVLSATDTEMERGPVTDRLFAVTFEGRWRHAPWPLLPRAAGRVYWEYAGEDFLPPGVVPLLPQISAPASLAGVELVSPRWDLGVEYTELEHPLVLWYGHSSLTAGYTHEGWLLGHPLGGTGESLAGTLRWRPRGSRLEFTLRGEHATAGRHGLTPGCAERRAWALALRSAHGLGGWRVEAARVDEQAAAFAADGPTGRTAWWRATLLLRL